MAINSIDDLKKRYQSLSDISSSDNFKKYQRGHKYLEDIANNFFPDDIPNRNESINRFLEDNEKKAGLDYNIGKNENINYYNNAKEISDYLSIPENFDDILNKYEDGALTEILIRTDKGAKKIKDIGLLLANFYDNPTKYQELSKEMILKEYSKKGRENERQSFDYALSQCDSDTILYILEGIKNQNINKFMIENKYVSFDNDKVKLNKNNIIDNLKKTVYENEQYKPDKAIQFVAEYMNYL